MTAPGWRSRCVVVRAAALSLSGSPTKEGQIAKASCASPLASFGKAPHMRFILQWVGKRESEGQNHGLNFRGEMAMREKLIVGAVVLLLVSWFALDAVAEIIFL